MIQQVSLERFAEILPTFNKLSHFNILFGFQSMLINPIFEDGHTSYIIYDLPIEDELSVLTIIEEATYTAILVNYPI